MKYCVWVAVGQVFTRAGPISDKWRHRLAPDHRTHWRVPQLVSKPALVNLLHPTAGPSKPGKKGHPNFPCNKSGFLIVQRIPLSAAREQSERTLERLLLDETRKKDKIEIRNGSVSSVIASVTVRRI